MTNGHNIHKFVQFKAGVESDISTLWPNDTRLTKLHTLVKSETTGCYDKYIPIRIIYY